MTVSPTPSADETQTGPEPARSGRSRRRKLAKSLAAILAVVVVLLLVLAIRYLPYVEDARAVSATAQRISDQVRDVDAGAVDRTFIDRLQADVYDLRDRTARLAKLLREDPLVRAAGGLDAFRSPLADAGTLLEATDEVVAAADLGLEMGDRFVTLRESGGQGSMLAGMVELMATSGASVDEIDQRLTRAEATLARIGPDATGTIRRAADLMAGPIGKYGPLLDQYRQMDGIIPGILGWGEGRRYLVLAQNPAELRPTGGYTGTVGIVSFQDGDLVSQDFMDVYQLDLKPGIPFVQPPPGLQEHLLGDASWQLADANWSPDFPTSAAQALDLYTLESGDDDVDGVIGLTTYAIDELLKVTGPIRVPDYDVTVAAGEVTLTALSLTRGISTPDSDRKAFLDSLASTLMDRLYALPAARWTALFAAFEEITERRLMLTWFQDAEAQGLVAGSAIAGEVRQEPGDYLYVVEANVAPTSKYNLVVERRSQLSVNIDTAGTVTNELQLTWQNDGGKPGEPYESIRQYSTNIVGFYGAYVRVLTPARSELLEAEGQDRSPITEVERVASESGQTSFANYLLMPPGASELRYAWRGPEVMLRDGDEWVYRLTIQKQPGMVKEPLKINVTLPDGAEVTSMTQAATVSDGTITFETVLEVDQVLEIRYLLP